MVEDQEMKLSAADIASALVSITSLIAGLLHEKDVVSRAGFAEGLIAGAGDLHGPAAMLLETLAHAIEPTLPPQFGLIEGGKE